MKLKLRQSTKKHIERNIGISISELSKMSAFDWDKYLQKKLNLKEIKMAYVEDPRLIGRGDPLLSLGRIIDIRDIDRQLAKLLRFER